MKKEAQQDLLRMAQKRLKVTRAGLALKLGVSPLTLKSWLLPDRSNGNRGMPDTARLLLAAILAQHKAKK